MSRIGRLPVELPAGVTASVEAGNVLKVKGPKGELAQAFSGDMEIKVEGNVITVSRPSDDKQHRALHGLTRALIANMVKGVNEEYVKELEIVGVGYRAQLSGKKLVLGVGFTHNVEIEAPEGIRFEVPAQTSIIVRGIDKQKVGQVAANIRAVKPPEPYKGKGIRYKDEHVRRKEGKTGM
ncbi:MAG: 50S ribosomal protein L6 [Clostridiales bacterium]|nr:50S ribosomal protein L6 [Clostridiales bacterium]